MAAACHFFFLLFLFLFFGCCWFRVFSACSLCPTTQALYELQTQIYAICNAISRSTHSCGRLANGALHRGYANCLDQQQLDRRERKKKGAHTHTRARSQLWFGEKATKSRLCHRLSLALWLLLCRSTAIIAIVYICIWWLCFVQWSRSPRFCLFSLRWGGGYLMEYNWASSTKIKCQTGQTLIPLIYLRCICDS